MRALTWRSEAMTEHDGKQRVIRNRNPAKIKLASKSQNAKCQNVKCQTRDRDILLASTMYVLFESNNGVDTDSLAIAGHISLHFLQG